MSLLFNHIHTQEPPKISIQSYTLYPFQEHLNTHIHVKLKKLNTFMYLTSKLTCTYPLNTSLTSDSKHSQIQVSPTWKQYYIMAILFRFAPVKAKSNDKLGCP
jgi:hypothetical protein